MKIKLSYTCAILLTLALSSCSGGTKTVSIADSTDTLAVEAEEVTTYSDDSGASYKIVDNRIIPTGGRPMIVDFSAIWCPPCQELKPIFAGLKDEYAGKVDMVTIDTDKMPDLTKQYGIRQIPTLLFFTDKGELVKQTTGFLPADHIRGYIDQLYNL